VSIADERPDLGSRYAGIIINEHTLTAAETRRHVDVLGRRFEFIHHDDLLQRIRRPRSRPFCLLTFDDGKRTGYTETAPALERLGVPALFFVTTQFVTDGQPLWFDRYDALRAALPRLPASLRPDTLKRLPHALLTERLDRACATYGVSLDAADERTAAMSWDHARDLVRRGFTVGAHGVRHAILTCEAERDALHEIEQSVATVSAETGRQCPTFSFPNGNYTARLARHALACGVRTVMTTEPMWTGAQFPAWRLPRLQLFGPQSRWKIALKVTLARTTGVLANADGTGRLYRRIMRLPGAAPRRDRNFLAIYQDRDVR
jgi:peptidoglycan/xylan/chitin deacetylase (PgdA/CDA1 family)